MYSTIFSPRHWMVAAIGAFEDDAISQKMVKKPFFRGVRSKGSHNSQTNLPKVLGLGLAL